MFLTMLATSCSTDDTVAMNEENSDNSDFTYKSSLCMPLTGYNGLNATIARSAIKTEFRWNENLTPDTSPYITYNTFIQVGNFGCDGSDQLYTSYNIDLFNSSSYLLFHSYECYEWRIVVQKYRFNGQVLDCETATEWQQSNP